MLRFARRPLQTVLTSPFRSFARGRLSQDALDLRSDRIAEIQQSDHLSRDFGTMDVLPSHLETVDPDSHDLDQEIATLPETTSGRKGAPDQYPTELPRQFDTTNVFSGGAPTRSISPLLRTSTLRSTLGPTIQKRHLFVGAQGSGVDADDDSSVKAVHDAYRGENKLLLAGPGKGKHSTVLSELGGAFQTEDALEGRLDEIESAHVEAWKKGDRELHMAGHSRGGNILRLYAERRKRQPLVDKTTGDVVAPAGLSVDSLAYFDSVPATPFPGEGTTLAEDGSFEAVPYDQLQTPSNVKFALHFLAGGEKRPWFEQANHLPQSQSTDFESIVVPNATHSEVGGKPGRDQNARDLVVSETIRRLSKRGFPFSTDQVLSADEHNRKLTEREQTLPNPGIVEQLTAYAGGGEQERKFPPDAHPLKPRMHEEDL